MDRELRARCRADRSGAAAISAPSRFYVATRSEIAFHHQILGSGGLGGNGSGEGLGGGAGGLGPGTGDGEGRGSGDGFISFGLTSTDTTEGVAHKLEKPG